MRKLELIFFAIIVILWVLLCLTKIELQHVSISLDNAKTLLKQYNTGIDDYKQKLSEELKKEKLRNEYFADKFPSSNLPPDQHIYCIWTSPKNSKHVDVILYASLYDKHIDFYVEERYPDSKYTVEVVQSRMTCKERDKL